MRRKNPPSRGRKIGKHPGYVDYGSWVEKLAPLKANRGKWYAFVMGSANSAQVCASRLRTGILEIPPGRWEFTSRGFEVFARYLGR